MYWYMLNFFKQTNVISYNKASLKNMARIIKAKFWAPVVSYNKA